MAYDAGRKSTILFGGGAANADPPRTDTWRWSAGSWVMLSPAMSPSNPGRMTYDSANASLMLLAGSLYSWNGVSWVNTHPAHLPSGGEVAIVAHDALARQLLVFVQGSPGTPSTWIWDGVDFHRQSPLHEPPQGPAVGAYDPLRGVVVAFVSGETWTWDGRDWSQQHPARMPLPRYFASMAYDSAIGKVVLFGGKTWQTVDGRYVEQVSNDLWSWDGSNWTQASG
jgi:hypothetical protein